MRLACRMFVLDREDNLYRLPASTFERMLRDPKRYPLPVFAGSRVRMSDVAVELVDKEPVRVVWSTFDILVFDRAGRFDVAAYEYIYFKGTADSTTDSEGNTVEPTDEENAAAKELAAANAAAALERYNDGEDLKTIAESYDNATYYSQDAGSKGSGALADWLFDDARQSGDCDVVDSDPNTYVVLFHSVGRQTYNTIDVRHILFQPDTKPWFDKEERR